MSDQLATRIETPQARVEVPKVTRIEQPVIPGAERPTLGPQETSIVARIDRDGDPDAVLNDISKDNNVNESRQTTAKLDSAVAKTTAENTRNNVVQNTTEALKIYEEPYQDPAIRTIEESITRQTNLDPDVMKALQSGDSRYTDLWYRNKANNALHEWNKFIETNPDKAAVYAAKYPAIKEALEGRERLRQYRERQQKAEAARPKTIQDNPTFRAYMDSPQTGLNARVWEGVSRAKSLTATQYDVKAKVIRAQMEQEFSAQHPDVWTQYSPVQTKQEVQPTDVSLSTSEAKSATDTTKIEPTQAVTTSEAQQVTQNEMVQAVGSTYEVKPVNSIKEISQRIREQVPDSMKAFTIDNLEKRKQELKNLPQIGSKALGDTLVGVDQQSTFEWILTNKIVGRTWEQPDSWSSEIESRKGRVAQVAKKIIDSEGDPQTMEQVFHPEKASERIKLTAIDGPAGPMYYVDDGTHRVTASMSAGLAEIPCDVKKIRYPLEQIATDNYQAEDWQRKIELGLIDGEIQDYTSNNGNKLKKLVVRSEVLPWIRTTLQSDLIKISRTYEQLYPDSLDHLKIPREALINPVANNFFMAGRWEEWKQRQLSKR